MKSVGIIGAGASGLCAIKHSINYGIEKIVAFEQTAEIGGTWVYRDETGKDKYGLDIHSSMYQGLQTNLPKEIMHFPDFPFAESTYSYLCANDVLNYYQSYADKFDLMKHIKFEHHVLRVRPRLDNSSNHEIWEVIVKDLKHDKLETYHFDAILVCNGHYNSPHIPDYTNRNLYKGRQVHSKDYRCPEPFKNENVLIIGAGPSARDALLAIQHVATSVTWSHHLKKLPCTKFEDNVIQKPDLRELTEDGAFFIDGSYQSFSVILYCTGYRYTFPFLSVDCGLTLNVCENYVDMLYKHCININRPSMGIIGLPNFVCPNQMFDLQVRFCLTFMTGRKQLPSREEMIDDLNNDKKIQFVERELPKKKLHYMGINYHYKYYQDLANAADIECIKPVISKMFDKGICLSLFDYDAFRCERFRVLDDEHFVIEKIEG